MCVVTEQELAYQNQAQRMRLNESIYLFSAILLSDLISKSGHDDHVRPLREEYLSNL